MIVHGDVPGMAVLAATAAVATYADVTGVATVPPVPMTCEPPAAEYEYALSPLMLQVP
jgi:hypothetical protein